MAISRIPDELFEEIRNRLNTRLHVSRFCAVCKSWRSLIPPFGKHLPLSINHPLSSRKYTLTESVVYRLAPLVHHPSKRNWLIKVKEDERGKPRMLHPFSQTTLKIPPNSVPKIINLLEYQVFEQAKFYTLHGPKDGVLIDSKVAMSSNLDSPVFVMILNRDLYGGKLCLGNKKCLELKVSLVPGPLADDDYQDVIFYQSKFFAVSKEGKLVAIDSCLNETIIVAAEIDCYGHENHKKYLVELRGELLLVDRFSVYMYEPEFKVFKLNEDKQKWVEREEEDLDDQILIAGVDGCFSVSTRDFFGCIGDRIYFSTPSTHAQSTIRCSEIGAFHLNSGTHSWLTRSREDNIFEPEPISCLSIKKNKRKKRKHSWPWRKRQRKRIGTCEDTN